MNYIGSKYKLSQFLYNTIDELVGDHLQEKVFCDGFAGTGIVGRMFKPYVKKIISNDIEYYSYVLNRNYIGNYHISNNWNLLIEQLNNEPILSSGFIYQNYCLGSGSGRQYFSDYNGQKIDTIRLKIEQLLTEKKIDCDTYYFLLCSLLESADKVANTASVYGAFLKHLKKTAQIPLILTPAKIVESKNNNKVYNKDINELIKTISGDILYLDPPYNSRQYGANYHLLNTIAEYKPFQPKGKTGMRDYQTSKYCSKKTVKDEFNLLIKNANFEYIFVSYNNEGLMTFEEIKEIMGQYGNYDCISTKYNRFQADKDSNRNIKTNSTIEYLHILKK
ncbi:MAG: DNA adenine methylase [Paludibacteraceae bacterium]|nr:DNA adenine methylase [Paludibacteraceae bacterium]